MRIESGVPGITSGVTSLAYASSSATVARPSDPPAPGSNQARMAAVVELIKALTGRDVELVPPAPYLVSGPVRPEPVELVAPPQPPPRPARDATGPVRVDITDVLQRGTSKRMRLAADGAGGFTLHRDLDLTL